MDRKESPRSSWPLSFPGLGSPTAPFDILCQLYRRYLVAVPIAVAEIVRKTVDPC
jgi:hypothetical protein